MSLAPKNGVSGIYIAKLQDHTTFNLNYLSNVLIRMDRTIIHHNYTPLHGKWIQMGGLMGENQWVNNRVYNFKNKQDDHEES